MGTRGRPKKNVQIEDINAKILRDSEGKEHVILVEDKKLYKLRNMLPGPLFFIRTDGSDGKIDGYGVIEDLDEKEYKRLKNSVPYKEGSIVEDGGEPNEIIKNSLNEDQMRKLFEKNVHDLEYMRNWIWGMDSIIALSRMKDFVIVNNYSAVISSYCDSRILEIQNEIEEQFKAPIDNMSLKGE